MYASSLNRTQNVFYSLSLSLFRHQKEFVTLFFLIISIYLLVCVHFLFIYVYVCVLVLINLSTTTKMDYNNSIIISYK